jgi:transglutaminase-like putative cysteine protease
MTFTERRAIRPGRAWWPGWARLGMAALATLTGWLASWSWGPMYTAPHRYLLPGLVCALCIAAVGAIGRGLRLPVYVVPLLQAAVAVLVLAGAFSSATGALGWLPTPQAVSDLFHQASNGSGDLNAYTAPVPERFLDVPVFLACCGASVAIGIDVFALGLRRVPLAGLPLLLALTVPITVLAEPLALGVFVSTGAAFLALLAAQHTDQLHGWGREILAHASTRRASGISVAAGRIGAAAIAGALVLPLAIPVSNGLFNGKKADTLGNGTRGVTLVNPMIDIRRDLIQQTHTPLVDVTTDDTDPSYLRLTVLDQFTGSAWQASDRRLPAVNQVGGDLPVPPGLSSTQPGQATTWKMRIEDTFETSWLPTPYPAISATVPGDWRYDTRFLDIVDVDKPSASLGLKYSVDAFHPLYDANVLDRAGDPVGQAVDNMTNLPRNLPRVIGRVARQVTKGAKTDYQQAAMLQDWFRTKGGFRYSTDPAPGSGAALLASFITRDKVGYCEQFAAAMAVMGRTLGIPARVVVGFLRPTGKASSGGHYTFTSDDLHAWPEFYFGGSGWVHFEPTPATRTGVAPAYTTQPLTPRTQDLPSAGPTPGNTATHKTTAPLPDGGNASSRGGGTSGWWWLLLVPVLVALAVPRLVRSRLRRHRLTLRGEAAEVARAAWAELRATALDHQMGWADGRTPRQALGVLRSRLTHDVLLVRDLEWFAEFVERARYARPFAVDEVTRARVHEVVQSWSRLIRDTASARARRRATWMPASLLDRAAADPVVIEEQRMPVGR